MKKVSVGHIARNGGLSRFLDEAKEAGEPLVILRNNEEIAIFLPYHQGMVSVMDQSMLLGQTLAQFEKEGLTEELVTFLLSQVLAGVTARMVLSSANVGDLEEALLKKFREQFLRG